MKMKIKRKIWVDNVKVIAAILVAVGHLMQSFVLSNVISDSTAYNYFNQTIYLFHVPLFFICSGFLYQQINKKQNFKDYSKNVLNKIIALGIPYIVFSGITYLLKFIFSSNVNNENKSSFLDTVFINPTGQYWFLYALFFLFLVSPIIKNKTDGIIRLLIGILLYMLPVLIDFSFLPALFDSIIRYTFSNLIWFILGMEIGFFGSDKRFKKYYGVLFIVFLILSVFYFINISIIPTEINRILKLALGIMACLGIICFIGAVYKNNNQTKIFGFLSKYTMPIFLMHTIFAAACRAVLLKLGITAFPVHLAVGLIASFVMPIIAAEIMNKIKLDIFYNPTKYIKVK